MSAGRPPRLQEGERIGGGEALALLARAFRFAGPVRGRLVAKAGLLFATLLPLLVLPWAVKIVIDHAIRGVPVGEQPLPYPPGIATAVGALEGLSPVAIILWVAAAQIGFVLLVGAVGLGGAERDQADADLASGHDQATETENAANAGFSMASGLLGLADLLFTIRITQALNHHYRSRLFERIQALPMASFEDERIGDAVFRVMYDTPSITEAVYRIVLTPFVSLAFALVVVGVLQAVFGAHPAIVWSAAGLLAIAFLATLPFAGALRRRGLGTRQAGAATTSSLEETLTNVLAVQSQGGEARERGRFDRDSWASFSRHRELIALAMGIFVVALVPAALVIAYAIRYIAGLVIEGAISVGDFGLLFTYFALLAFAAVEMGALWIRVQRSASGLKRVFFLMDLPAEADRPWARPIPRLRERITVEDVHYAYADGTPALRGVSFEARVGEILALVGPAGAGKTTLASLLPRFLEPDAGRVRFDGRDVAEATLESVRRQVAFVFQETALFDATVAENIRVGHPEATDAEVERAARVAGAEEFIRRLPQGYATRLGRSGGKLSVGQRQRLAIARAVVRPAPILILDEPTSALDTETEQRLVATLREVSRERLVVVIAHRLSTVRSAERILFLDEGVVREEGSPAELLARPGGAYRRFVELQTRGAA